LLPNPEQDLRILAMQQEKGMGPSQTHPPELSMNPMLYVVDAGLDPWGIDG